MKRLLAGGNLFLIAGFLAGVIVYLIRTSPSSEDESLWLEDGRVKVLEPALQAFLDETIPADALALGNLLVVTDIVRDCPVFEDEALVWADAQALFDRQAFRVKVLLPDDTPPEAVEMYLDRSGLVRENIVPCPRNGTWTDFHRFGLLKIFFTAEAGIHWVEMGEPSARYHDRLLARLIEHVESIND